MQDPALFVITDADEPTDQTAERAEAVLRHWQPADKRPAMVVLSAEQLRARPQRLDRSGVVWLHSHQGEAALQKWLDPVAEHHLPALLTRPGEVEPTGALYQDGVTICRPDTPPEQACAMLQALMSQARSVQSLSTELRLMNAHRGGLQDQMGKLDEELRLAARLQQQFLPQKLPSLGNVTLHALWRPASYVSGDIYDGMRLDEHHVGFFLADAVGHGVPAALMTMYIKRSLHTKEVGSHLPGGYRLLEPAETLNRLNQDMLATQNGQVHFATACYGIIDCRDHTVQLARAGHPYPMRLRPDGNMETLEPEGGLLGVFEHEEYDQETITLEHGDRLLLYSDGFELAFPETTPEGKTVVSTERYQRELRALGDGAADASLQRLLEKVDNESGSLNQQDDLTVLCLTVGAELNPNQSQHTEAIVCEAAVK